MNRHASRNLAAERTRTKAPEVRREELMDAAAALFTKQGADATTVDQIVAAAGVAKGTFYHYFASKPDILLALRERYARGFLQRVEQAMQACPADDWDARIRCWTEVFIDGYLDTKSLHDVVFHQHIPGNYQKERDDVLNQIQHLLDEGERAGRWKLDSSRMAAIIMFRAVHGVVDDLNIPSEADRRKAKATLVRLFLRMLGDGDGERHKPSPQAR